MHTHLLRIGLVALFSWTLATTASAFDKEDARQFLENKTGLYVLARQHPARPCSNLMGLKVGDLIRVRVVQRERSDDFHRVGDLDLLLERFYPSSPAQGKEATAKQGKWLRVFDRADFTGIGESARRTITSLGIISHRTIFDEGSQTLTHTSSQSIPLVGAQIGEQVIHFATDGQRFSYSYAIADKNALGGLKERTFYDECSFQKSEK